MDLFLMVARSKDKRLGQMNFFLTKWNKYIQYISDQL